MVTCLEKRKTSRLMNLQLSSLLKIQLENKWDTFMPAIGWEQSTHNRFQSQYIEEWVLGRRATKIGLPSILPNYANRKRTMVITPCKVSQALGSQFRIPLREHTDFCFPAMFCDFICCFISTFTKFAHCWKRIWPFHHEEKYSFLCSN